MSDILGCFVTELGTLPAWGLILGFYCVSWVERVCMYRSVDVLGVHHVHGHWVRVGTGGYWWVLVGTGGHWKILETVVL